MAAEDLEPKQRFLQKEGKLKIFVGAAPGVGKTYTMLNQARDLLRSGRDVVIGYIESHGRQGTISQTKGFEILPRKKMMFHGRMFEEMDLDAIIARSPDMVVIDELAHTNIEGAKFSKRYMDVAFILKKGIDVFTTVNIQHLENASKYAEKITGTKVREIVPQSFIERTDEIEIVDVPPETVFQRLKEGNIYPNGQRNTEQALSHFFKMENLSALRELSLRVVGNTVDERFQKSFERKNIPGPVGAKEVILVCASFLQRSARLMRKGYRLAERLKADLFVLTILDIPEADLPATKKERIRQLKSLAAFCNAAFISEQRNDRKLSAVVKAVAGRLNATQIVVGQPDFSRRPFFRQQNLVSDLLTHTDYADLHIIGWKKEHLPLADRLEKSLPLPPPNDSLNQEHRRMGRLTIYIGAAPGVGKTYQMLQDANEWLSKGVDVVAGLIDTHEREETAAQIRRLEVLPLKAVDYNGRHYHELDVDGIIKRRPEIAIVDELAHTNVPGSKRAKRYLDIMYLLQHGIHVVTAVNIQHLESLRDKVAHITGVEVRERVPDWFLEWAWQIKLVDVTPEMLQRRLLEGKIYSKNKVEHAMNHFFRLGNLFALRELALFEAADDVSLRLAQQLEKEKKWIRSKRRVLVCVSFASHSGRLIRRGWRLADRYHTELYILAVIASEVLTEKEKANLSKMEQVGEQFQAVFLKKKAVKNGVGEMIAKTAERLRAEQIVVGRPKATGRFFRRYKLNPVMYVFQHAEFVNLHVVANTKGIGMNRNNPEA